MQIDIQTRTYFYYVSGGAAFAKPGENESV